MANADSPGPPPIRTATREDAPQITQLLQEATYYHVHLDWRLPVDWIGSPGFVVVPPPPSQQRSVRPTLFGGGSKLRGCLAATADPVPGAWVRVACMRDVARPEAMLQHMLELVIDFLRKRTVSELGWLAIESWPNAWLPHLGFHHYCDVETYIKNDLASPNGPTAPDLTIRPVAAEDIPALEAIEAATFAPLWRHSGETLQAVRRQAFSFDVALYEGSPVGFQFSLQAEDHAHLARMAVAPQAQQQGIGSALLRHAIRNYRQHRFRYISLNTQTNNLPSQLLYEKFGFEASGQRYPVWRKRLDPPSSETG